MKNPYKLGTDYHSNFNGILLNADQMTDKQIEIAISRLDVESRDYLNLSWKQSSQINFEINSYSQILHSRRANPCARDISAQQQTTI